LNKLNTVPATGSFSGEINLAFNTPIVLQQLEAIQQLLNMASAQAISHGPDYVVRAPLNTTQGVITIAIKVFKRQAYLKDLYDHKHKSKAQRSFSAARYLCENGINTPSPIAWLDRWENKRLIESYYVCVYEEATCFRDELVHIYRDLRNNEPLMNLLLCVAPAIRAMHDAGFMHGDMGNQNILLSKNEKEEWAAPCFIDLNRCKISEQSPTKKARALTDKERAFDISRIILPGDYLRIFKWVYQGNQDTFPDLEKYDAIYRKKFEWHRKSRKWRHPFRHLKNRHNKPSHPTYPEPRDLWLWDEKSAQPMISLSRKEKNKHRNLRNLFLMAIRTLSVLPNIYREYRKLKLESFNKPLNMRNRIGVALHPKANYIEPELKLLAQLGNPPVLLRFYHHEMPADWQLGIELAQRLHSQSTPFMVALVHDREAILNSERWALFLETVITALADKAEKVEVTHALNRVKWGIWSNKEFIELMRPALTLRERHPKLTFIGPAGIDFEYHTVINALSALKSDTPFAALSHLLYVDRRGAPENKQGGFSLLEKSALLKAVACVHPQVADQVIVSEVNWPLKNGGIWSPILCPYLRPGWSSNPAGETEEDYANYMLRYLVISLCSGHVEQVFWWRLSAHGFGLVDDLDNFRVRPAFTALAFFLKLLGNADFLGKWKTPKNSYGFEFKTEKQKIIMAWATHTEALYLPDVNYDHLFDRSGEKINDVKLTGSPIYFVKNVD
jgi:tRNA A-37 threonylcarbamoyl transferase component Bud32